MEIIPDDEHAFDDRRLTEERIAIMRAEANELLLSLDATLELVVSEPINIETKQEAQ